LRIPVTAEFVKCIRDELKVRGFRAQHEARYNEHVFYDKKNKDTEPYACVCHGPPSDDEKAIRDTVNKAFGSFNLKEERRSTNEDASAEYTRVVSAECTRIVGILIEDVKRGGTHGNMCIQLKIPATTEFLRCIGGELKERGFMIQHWSQYNELIVTW